MKWFKHFSDAHDDEKLSEALCIHGAGAYGVFWLIVEAVAAQMDKTDRCSARYHYKKWATIAHVDRRTLTRYLHTFNILTLIVSQECDNFVIIEIPKLLLLRDNYTKDLQATTRKTSKQEVEVEVEEEKPLNLCERDFIISQHKRIFARPITPTEFGKFGYLMQFPEAKIEKAFTSAKGKKSLNYVISVLENDKLEKPKKRMLRK